MLSTTVLLALAASASVDPPRVEVLDSSGALDGPKGSRPGPPRWSRVRLGLEVKNHLPVRVEDLVLDIALLGSAGEAIPGWTFHEVRLTAVIPPQTTSSIQVDLDLPQRRRSPPADEIAYRVRVRDYRADPATVPLAFELLGSSHPSDQRAALSSFERDPAWPEEQLEGLARALREALEALPRQPTATDALRMLLAVRAIGTLELAGEVPLLLALPERLDRQAWGRGVLDLASRMVVASAPDDPRLLVLPRWARRVATLLGVNAGDALAEATRDAISRVGDAAVPALVRAAAFDPAPGVRERARRILEMLGRGTARAQIGVGDATDRVELIRILGHIGDPEAVPALVEVLTESDSIAAAAGRALVTMGAPSMPALVEALGRRDDRRARQVLTRLGTRHRDELTRLSVEAGVELPATASPSALVDALAARRRGARLDRLQGELADAIALGAQGAYRAALARLDRIYEAEPRLYMRYADPIARIYVARADRLLERGDYEAALRVLSDGQTVRPLPEAEMRLTDARLALARGFLELGDLDRAEAELKAAPIATRGDVLEVRAAWLEQTARRALDEGRSGDARRMIDSARAIAPDDLELRLLDRRVAMSEHLAVVLTLALCLPALALALAILARRYLERRRVERLAAALDA